MEKRSVSVTKGKGKYKLYQLYSISIAVWQTAENLAA